MVISTETHESQDFVKLTIMWILVIFSKLVDLILISLDRIRNLDSTGSNEMEKINNGY